MQKAKGMVPIAIGSIGMIISSIGLIIIGIIMTFALSFVFSLFAGSATFETEALGGIFSALGAVAGILVIMIGVLVLALSIMAFKRRNDPLRAVFCIVIGAIFLFFGVISLLSDVSYANITEIVLSVLILVGGILNAQQKGEFKAAMQQQAPYGGAPYAPYGQPQIPFSALYPDEELPSN